MVRTRSGRQPLTPNSAKTERKLKAPKMEVLHDDHPISKPLERVDSVYATFLKERVYERKRSLTNAEAHGYTHSAMAAGETNKPQVDKMCSHEVKVPKHLTLDTANLASTQREDRNSASNGNAHDDLVSKSHRQEFRSLTEMAQDLYNDDLSEVDSVRGDISNMSVNGYTVKPEHANLLTSILSRHGDIAANCTLNLDIFGSFIMQYLCDVILKLRSSSIGLISETELNEMLRHLNEFEKACVEVGWLKKRVYKILAAKKAISMLRPSSELKQVYAEIKAKNQKTKARLEACKNDIAIKEAEVQLLKNDLAIREAEEQLLQGRYNSICTELAAGEKEAGNTVKMINECKANLRHIVELDSLDHGLS